ncbi:hypothetical protein ABW21_db0200542 [Orbilia brochopaga]|nr:hypothetical protein ABW21_db0200542 [Drechslerella brochopaga]
MAATALLGMTAVPESAPPGGAQATGIDRMGLQRCWLDRALTVERPSPEGMRTFLISTVDLIYDQATEISFRTAIGLLEQPVLDRLRVVVQQDWLFTEGFSEYSWPSHGFALLKIIYRFPKFAGTFSYELQEGVFKFLFPSLEDVKTFLRKVIRAVQFLYENDDKEDFTASVIISLSVFAQILKIVLKHRPADTRDIREMIVRLTLLILRTTITQSAEREEVRRDAKALVAIVGLTDDIRIQATGDLRFHFSNAFYNIPCHAGTLQACTFGETWCCLKHKDESFEHAQERVLRLDLTKSMERDAKEAERMTSQKEMRAKRDRKAIERCLAQGIEVPSYLRHYNDLIQSLKKERGLDLEKKQGKQPAVPVASKQKIDALMLESSSSSAASNTPTPEPDLIDLLGDIITEKKGSRMPPAATKPSRRAPRNQIVSRSLLDDFVTFDYPALPQASTPSPESQMPDIWDYPLLVEEVPLSVPPTLPTANDDLLCLATFYAKEGQQSSFRPQTVEPAPSSSLLLLPDLPDLSASVTPIGQRKTHSAYEPSIFDLSDEDTSNLGPILQPTLKPATGSALYDLKCLTPKPASVRPALSRFSTIDDSSDTSESSDSGDSIKTVSPKRKAEIIANATERVLRRVQLPYARHLSEDDIQFVSMAWRFIVALTSSKLGFAVLSAAGTLDELYLDEFDGGCI